MNANTVRALARLLVLSLVFALPLALPPAAQPLRANAGPVRTASLPAPESLAPPAADPVPAEPGLRLVEATAEGIVLELATPDFHLEADSAEGVACQRLRVDGYASSDAAGRPELPVRGALLGVPPEAALSLAVLESESVVLPGRYELCPVAQPVVEGELSGRPRSGGAVLRRDAAAYAADALYPTAAAEVVSTGFVRSQRVAQLRFHPFRYNPASGQVVHLRRIRVRLAFDGVAEQVRFPGPQQVDEGAFEPLLRNLLSNYVQAREWRVAEGTGPADPATRTPDRVSGTGAAYRILVNADGLYQVTPAALQAAGLDLGSVDPRTFRLTNRGQEVRIYVTGESDGAFSGGDVLLFYGQALDTRYTDQNVYRLTWGSGSGLRMATLDGTPGAAATPAYFVTTRHAETNATYQSNYPSGPAGDHWYWNYVFATGAPASKRYTVTLSHVASAPVSATLRGLLRGYDAVPEHHTRVYLNGHLVDEATWMPKTERLFEAGVPQAYLVNGSNIVTVTSGISNTQDVVFVNWFEIDYAATYSAGGGPLFFDGEGAGTWKYHVGGFDSGTLELFDVSAPAAPRRVLNAAVQSGTTYTLTFQHTITGEQRYLALSPAQRLAPLRIERDAPSDLRSAANGADYIAITHGSFYTAVQPLVDYRSAQGLRARLVNVQDVYDEFSDGVFDPHAIRDFLAYAYANWTAPAPSYVLLVGDGNYDFRNYWGWNEPNYIPPYLAFVDNWIGEAAADNRYVCVSGEDTFPDMHLGRLPVKTAAQAGAVVSKILAYEQSPPAGDWNRQVLFVADNSDSGGEFDHLSDAIANNYVPVPYTTQKIYYGITHATGSAARTAIINAISQGRLLVNYIGHGSTQIWASEHLFRIGDVATLTNTTGKLPLMAPMTCLDGYYIHPSPSGSDLSSLGETIVRAQGKGAIASWSPTGMSLATGHDFLNRGLYEAFFFDGVTQLGPATTQGKLYLYTQSGGYRDLLDTYLLFGDPALALNVLRTDVGISKRAQPVGALFGTAVTYTLAYSNTGPAMAFGVVISDVLPAGLLNPVVTSSGVTITARPGTHFVWDVADLPAGAGGAITITASLPVTFTGQLDNVATIAAGAVETSTANNTARTLTGIDLEIARSGSDAVLNWTAASGATAYNIHRSTQPYFTPSPATLLATRTGLTYTDAGAIGNPAQNYFYVVAAVDAGSRESLPSARVGEFDFTLLPGAAGAPDGRYNVVAAPLHVAAWLPSASALADYVGPSVQQVLHWDAGTQTYEFWIPAIAFGTDFALQTGHVYWLQLDSTAPPVLSLVGRVPAAGSVRFDLSGAGPNCLLNDISLPLDQDSISSASQLGAAISQTEQVLQWDEAAQVFEFWLPEIGFGTDFATRPGYPYHVCLKGGAPGRWP